jgi:hypothetical protein
MQSSLGRIVRPAESKVRAKRVGADLTAETRTIGVPLAFKVIMENVSRTGFLLSPAANDRMPYQINTLIEMTVDPGAAKLERPIFLLGRIVRTVQADDLKQFGVHIVQIDSKDYSSWEKYISGLEGKAELAALTAG